MVSAYLVLKWVHVLSAAFLVGSMFTEWALRKFASRTPDRARRAFTWEFLVKGEEMIAIPFAIALLVSGLLMVFGPASGGWSFERDMWLTGGLALFLIILVLMAGLAASSAKKAHAAYAEGDGEAAAAPHEKRYAMLSLVGGILVLAAVWLMVVKPF